MNSSEKLKIEILLVEGKKFRLRKVYCKFEKKKEKNLNKYK